MFTGLWVAGTRGSYSQVVSPDNEEALDPVVVTGTAYPTTLGRSTASVTVITREEIEARRADTVSELLQRVPGLYVDQPASRGGVTSVYIRGGDPNFTLVLIDGVKVNDPTNSRGGSFDFSTLSTDNIERIEVVRDPMSSIYGSDALSGVINIITKKGKGKTRISPEFSGGRYGQYRFLAGMSGSPDILSYSFTGSYIDEGEQVEGSKFKSPTFNANLGLFSTDTVEINSTLRYSHIDSSSFPDDSGGPEFAVIRSVDERNIDQFLLGIKLVHVPFEWWDYEVKFGFYYNKEKFSSPGVAPGIRDPLGIPPNESDTKFSRYDVNLINRFSLYDTLDLVAGFETEIDDGSGSGTLFGEIPVSTGFDLNRYILSPYLELHWAMLEDLTLVLGSRVDFPKDFDSEFSPRVGVSYKIKATDTILRANWGEGFKLPSFFALSNPIVGNPGLDPEKSRSIDLGINQFIWDGRVEALLNFYYSEYQNLIDFDEGPPPRLVNRSRVTIKGFEFIIEAESWKKLKLNGNLTYAASDIKGTNEVLRNRPRWWGGFSILFRPTRVFDINIDALFVGKVFDSSIPTGDVTLDSYSVFDLAATWNPHKKMRIFLAVDNLFNERYEQFVGFPAPGISPRAGVKLTF